MITQLPSYPDLTRLFSLTDEQAHTIDKLADGLPYAADDFADAVIHIGNSMLLPCNNRMARILSMIEPERFSDENVMLNADLSELGLPEAPTPVLQ